MSYINAPATRLLATNCCVCGKALVDSVSVELGIGPDCRNGDNAGIDAETQRFCNQLTYAAAVAAQEGRIEDVRTIADQIRFIGLGELADKIASRFVNAEKNAKIVIREEGGRLVVGTPYRRKAGVEFVDAWRAIPGRQYDRTRSVNLIPLDQKGRLWTLLCRFFPGEFGKGPKGLFRIPKEVA
jgi:hypothetical protein